MRIISWFKKKLGLDKKENKYKLVLINGNEEVVIKPNCLYLEKRGDKNRWVYLKCPCKCNETISINLMKSAYPNWNIRINNGDNVTLYPSVDKTTGCKSHFFIRNSTIVWARSLPI